MTYCYFHPEEEFQVWALEKYADERPGTKFLVEFADGEAYVCVVDTAWDSDNAGELDNEMDTEAVVYPHADSGWRAAG